MTINIQKTIDYMLGLKTRGITYSMLGSRDGSDGTGDCSGTVTRAVSLAGGVVPAWLYNTESMHAYLKESGYKLIVENDPNGFTPKKGDIFIWGKQGQSAGAFGHTGIFYDDNENIIHCNYGYNGVTINQYDDIASANGFPYYYIYRPTVENKPTPPKPGKRRKGWRVDQLAFEHGIWQIRCDALCPTDFDWLNNGINPMFVDKIDPGTGEKTKDQVLKEGDYFAFQELSLGVIVMTTYEYGWSCSQVQFPDGFVWLNCKTIKELVYG